jgi:hypothetical protein
LSIYWITVGGIGQKREDVNGQIATRDYLNLTVGFDRNMVDPPPPGRPVHRAAEGADRERLRPAPRCGGDR